MKFQVGQVYLRRNGELAHIIKDDGVFFFDKQGWAYTKEEGPLEENGQVFTDPSELDLVEEIK